MADSKAERYAQLEIAAAQARPRVWNSRTGMFSTAFSVTVDGKLQIKNNNFNEVIPPEKVKELI